MNTLLPFPDFSLSAECLDDRRLNKQRSDIIQIIKRLTVPETEENKDHTAVKMWRGNEKALIQYGMAVCLEFASRGNTDATLKKIMDYKSIFEDSPSGMPEWFGDEAFHDSHKAYLLRLMPTHYRRFWPTLSDELHLMWPRSPQKVSASAEQREIDRLHKKAVKARENLNKAQQNYIEACETAGLDPETFEYIDGAQVVEIGVPDPDVINL